MNPPDEVVENSPGRVLRIFATALGLTLLSDFLLWNVLPGLSWGLFLLSVAAAVAVNRPRTTWNRLAVTVLALLVLTAAQSAVEISFSNVLVSLVLLIGLVGETAYPGLRSGWERQSEALFALTKAPGRWLWAADMVSQQGWARSGAGERVIRAFRIAVPALFLGGLFACLFASGNAILGSWYSKAVDAFWKWLLTFDFSFGHFLFDLFLATVALVLLRPAGPGRTPRWWTRTIPRMAEGNLSIAWWRTVVILGLLNGIFFVANTLDALYLWSHVHLPAGVGYSQYVHEGVASLVAAVLFSALLLAALFQQSESVSQSPLVKRLGYLWIAQNVVLIASVVLRLVRYIQAFFLTTQRVYALCFVALVAAGFVLLALWIARNRSLNGLILSNAAATVAIFFFIQFVDVAGLTARYNVAAWDRNPKRGLDIAYLKGLGSPAWDSLLRVAGSRHPEARGTRSYLEKVEKDEQRKQETQNWRSWQGRNAFNMRDLHQKLAQSQPL